MTKPTVYLDTNIVSCYWYGGADIAGLAGVDSQAKFGPNVEEARFMSADVIVDQVRRVRDELVKRYGGLDGWIDHLQAMDRERAGKMQRPTAKKRVSNGRKRRKPSVGPPKRRPIKDI